MDVYIEKDGSISSQNTVNIFQFSNDCVGVKMHCPYDPQSVLAFITIELANGTVLDERTMGFCEKNDKWYAYSYVFPEAVTELSGMKYSTTLFLAFRFEDQSGVDMNLTSAKVPVTVQPSLRGGAATVTDSEAANLQKQINDLTIAISEGLKPATAETLGGIKVGDSLSILKDGKLSVDITNGSSPLKIALDTKVPKTLDVLRKVTDAELNDPDKREAGRAYLDCGGEASYATLKQLKEMNTKILCVEQVGDVSVLSLSNGDFVFLKKE